MTAVRGVRGATTAASDRAEDVIGATRELLERLIEDNGIEADDVAGVWLTATADLRSEFPAVAARQLGWVDVPLLCGQEMAVDPASPRSLPRCIRVLVLVNTARRQREMRPAYLRDAVAIKAELERARAGNLSPSELVEGAAHRGHHHPPPRTGELSPSELVEET